MAKKSATNSHKIKQLTRAEKRFNKTADELFGTHSKSKLGKRRTEYVKERIKLENRVKSWKRKYGVDFPLSPPHAPKRITKETIQRVKNITWKNIPNTLKTPAQKLEYSPPTESDYMNYTYDTTDEWGWYEPDWDESWGTRTSEPAISEEEMEAWIEEKIEQILNPSLVEREREGAKETLRAIIDNARQELGTKAFYEKLQDPDFVRNLEDTATRYINSYKKKNGTDTGEEPLTEFAQALNLDRPLSDEQAYTLNMYGAVSFDYSDTDYE